MWRIKSRCECNSCVVLSSLARLPVCSPPRPDLWSSPVLADPYGCTATACYTTFPVPECIPPYSSHFCQLSPSPIFYWFSHIWWSLLCVLSVRWEQQREEATSEWLKQRKNSQQMGRRLLQILELFLTLPRCLHSQTHRDCKLILKGIVWITQRPVWDSGSITLSKSITVSRYYDYSSKMRYFERSG